MKKLKFLIPVFAISICLSACGSSGNDSNSTYMDSINASGAASTNGFLSNSKGETFDSAVIESSTDISNEYVDDSISEKFSSNEQKKYSDKLVYTCSMRIQTLNYDESLKSIREKITFAGGFISSENEYDDDYRWYYSDYSKSNATRNITVIARIPSDKYDEFLSSLDGDGKIISKSSNVENISKRYYDTEAVIESLEIQEARLLGMMEQAQTIDEMITVEQRLTEVQTQLNQYRTSLSVMQSDVDFSTVTVNLEEVFQYDETIHTNTFFDRLGNTLKDAWRSFGRTLEDLLFFVIMAIPQLVIFIPIIVLIVFVLKKIKKIIRNRVNKRINTLDIKRNEEDSDNK